MTGRKEWISPRTADRGVADDTLRPAIARLLSLTRTPRGPGELLSAATDAAGGWTDGRGRVYFQSWFAAFRFAQRYGYNRGSLPVTFTRAGYAIVGEGW